jgi:hypothetical protein
MINSLAKLYLWLNKNSLIKEAARVSAIVKIANEFDENRLFDKYQKLESMFLSAEKSDDQGIKAEGATAKRMAERLKEKFKKITGKDFEIEYLDWKRNNNEASSRVDSDYYKSKATYPSYDWRNYYNEMEELLDEYDTNLHNITQDFIEGNISRERAIELLGEDSSEWLNEMAAEMRAEMSMGGYYRAQEREAMETQANGYPSWMSPNDIIEEEERKNYLDWRNQIEASGAGDLLFYLNATEKEYRDKLNSPEPGLVRQEENPIIRIQKSKNSKPIEVRKDDLIAPDAKPNKSIYYGVTKLDYASEYMRKEFEKIINEDDSEYYNQYMQDLFDNSSELFSKFQMHESENNPGGNKLVDHMMEELNLYGKEVADNIIKLNKDIYYAITWNPLSYRRQNAQVFPLNAMSRTQLEEVHGNFYRSNTKREKALLRFLNDVEEEVSGRNIHKLKHAHNKYKYPFIFFIDDLKEIYGFLYKFGESISNREKNSEEKSRKLNLEFIDIKKDIASLPKFENVFRYCLVDFDRVRTQG